MNQRNQNAAEGNNANVTGFQFNLAGRLSPRQMTWSEAIKASLMRYVLRELCEQPPNAEDFKQKWEELKSSSDYVRCLITSNGLCDFFVRKYYFNDLPLNRDEASFVANNLPGELGNLYNWIAPEYYFGPQEPPFNSENLPPFGEVEIINNLDINNEENDDSDSDNNNYLGSPRKSIYNHEARRSNKNDSGRFLSIYEVEEYERLKSTKEKYERINNVINIRVAQLAEREKEIIEKGKILQNLGIGAGDCESLLLNLPWALDQEGKCHICLNDEKERNLKTRDGYLRHLPCGHRVCGCCAKEHFKEHLQCPVCKFDLKIFADIFKKHNFKDFKIKEEIDYLNRKREREKEGLKKEYEDEIQKKINELEEKKRKIINEKRGKLEEEIKNDEEEIMRKEKDLKEKKKKLYKYLNFEEKEKNKIVEDNGDEKKYKKFKENEKTSS